MPPQMTRKEKFLTRSKKAIDFSKQALYNKNIAQMNRYKGRIAGREYSGYSA